MIGRFVIKRSWTPHDWLLANHPGLYILTCVVLLSTLPVIGLVLSWILNELRLLLVALTIIGVTVFTFWTSHKVTFRNSKLVKDLTLEMVDLGCMTEYDGQDYEIDYHLTAIGGVIICMWAGLVISLVGSMLYRDLSFVFILVLILLILPGVYYLFTSLSRSMSYNLCYEHHSWVEEEEEEFGEFEDSEYLQTEFSDLIQRLEIKNAITKRHETEFSMIKAGYSKTEYAQCRWFHDFVEEDTLHIVCRDVSEAAARRHGTAWLAKLSLPFYTDLSFKRRAVELIAFFFGFIMIVVIILVGAVFSKEVGIGTVIFAAVVYSALCRIGMKQNIEIRRDLPVLLGKTGVYSEYELKYYNNKMFPISPRFDWALLTTFLLIFFVIGYLILVSS
ncbi:MAG: hypothetical protein ACFFBJ_13065 [Promethearchaeota archaeon]